jgi:hypothetical protein
MSIRIEDRPSSDVLMESVEACEKANKVVIILETDNSIMVKTNCSYKDLKWLLDQSAHATLNELFGVASKKDISELLDETALRQFWYISLTRMEYTFA